MKGLKLQPFSNFQLRFFVVQEYWNYKFRDVKSGFEDIDDNHLRMDVYPNISPLHVQNNTFRDTQRLFMDDIAAFTPLQLRWNSYLSNANMAPKLGILILNVYYGHKIPIRPKFLISLAIVALCFVVTSVMSKVDTDGFQNGFLGLTLVTVVLISSFSGICQVQIETCLIIHHRLIFFLFSKPD